MNFFAVNIDAQRRHVEQLLLDRGAAGVDDQYSHDDADPVCA